MRVRFNFFNFHFPIDKLSILLLGILWEEASKWKGLELLKGRRVSIFDQEEN